MNTRKIAAGAALLYAGAFAAFASQFAQADGGTLMAPGAAPIPQASQTAPSSYRWDGRTFATRSDLAIYFLERLAREGLTGVSGGVPDTDDDGDVLGDADADLTVTTNAAENIDEDSARLSGEVALGEEDTDVEVWFAYGEARNDLDRETAQRRIAGNADSAEFEATVSNLEEGTTYYFRAVAEDVFGTRHEGTVRSFRTDGDEDDDDSNAGDEPAVTTGNADAIEATSARIEGEVDMNDFEDGIVFFVFGTEEDTVESVEDDFDRYADIDENGDELRKVRAATGLDDDAEYRLSITGLAENTTYYYAIGVEYEDDDGDPAIRMGSVEEFETE